MRSFSALLILMASIGLPSGPAHSEDSLQQPQRERGPKYGWFWGAGVAMSSPPYQGYSHRITPLPMIGYMGERLRIFGPFISYDVVKEDAFELRALLQPRFDGHKAGDSDVFLGMAKRKWTLEAGIGSSFNWENWSLGGDFVVDALGRHNGYQATLGLSYRYQWGPISFVPMAEVERQSGKLVDYYFGVESSEVAQNRMAYNGEATTNAAVGFALAGPVLGGRLRLNAGYKWLGQEIKRSPLVDSTSSINLMLSLSRFF